jgi:predicted dehydrogenase
MIGLDTSHALAFARVINNPDAKGDVADIQVVAAYPASSPDLPSSYERVEGFTTKLREMGIEIVDSIDSLLNKVDVVMIESVDGRPHLQQAKPAIAAGKPVWIDKPMAGSLADGVEIFRLAREAGVPCFSSSSMRYAEGVVAVCNDPKIGEVVGCMIYSPCSLEPHHPDLYWYGIHGVEALFTIMGPGCVSVTRVQTEDTDVVTGVWRDGRVGTFRGKRAGKRGYGGLVFGTKGIGPIGSHSGYEALVVEIAKFFKTGKAPVSPEETLEVLAFMEAADESKRQGGGPVTLESVMAKARQANAERK